MQYLTVVDLSRIFCFFLKSVKTYDTGLAAFLLGIQNVEHVFAHPLRGSLFENMIVSEVLKQRFNQGKTDNLYFLRDSKGREVDILLDYGTYLDMLGIKSSKTLAGDSFKGLIYYKHLYTQTRNCFLVYGGDLSRVQKDIQTVPWNTIASLEVE